MKKTLVDPNGEGALADSSDDGAREGLNLGAFNGIAAGDVAFLNALWRAIELRLPYSEFLSEYNHAGSVDLQFHVDERGRFESSRLKAAAEDRVLKVIAARTVRATFREETLPKPTGAITVHARFLWASPLRCEAVARVQRRALGFCRTVVNERKSFSRGERFREYARAINRHGPWAVEEIRKYNRKARRRESEFDPFEDLRRDPDWTL